MIKELHQACEAKVTDEEKMVVMIRNEEPSDENVSRVSQIALHDGLALVTDEVDLTSTQSLKWLYGLLCVLEKPLLPD